MPLDALELQALDVLEQELLKIGTAPLSDWRTQEQPTVRVGPPGDKIPGPSKCSIHVQHIRSERGTDAVGTASHILRSTFAVWCFSSHAADGHRRSLQLLEDARDALLAAEPTFYEIFGYGISIGNAERESRESQPRQGIDGLALEVVVEMDKEHPVPFSLINHPFEFPFPRTGKARMLTGTPICPLVGDLTNGATQVIFESPVGTSGIVRNMNLIAVASQAGNPVAPDMNLRIFYDGEASPSVSIPLINLLGADPATAGDMFLDLFLTTTAFELSSGMENSFNPGSIRHISGCFKLPIPYMNGIKIDVQAGPTSVINTIFANVIHQDELPRCWNQRLRLFAVRSSESLPTPTALGNEWKLESPTSGVTVSGTFPASIVGKAINVTVMANTDYIVLARPDPTHITLDPRETVGALLNTPEQIQFGTVHTFLNVPSASGYLALVLGTHTGDDTSFEGNPRFFLDGHTSPDLRWTSVEDMMNGSFYFAIPNRNDDGGITAHGPSERATYYKNFVANPVRFANGIVGKVPHAYSSGPGAYHWTTFYYKQV